MYRHGGSGESILGPLRQRTGVYVNRVIAASTAGLETGGYSPGIVTRH